MDTKDFKAFIWMNRLPGSFHRKVLALLAEQQRASEIKEKILSDFAESHEAVKKLLESFDPEEEIEEAQKRGVRIMVLSDPDYPFLLKQISDPPLVLYIEGSLIKEDQSALAMVGTRHPSYYGTEQAKLFAKDLVSRGLTIVSGLAQGIDQAAHQAALEIAHGRTIAVLGCGLDRDYPSGSDKLRAKIVKQGALVSEYAFGTPPLAENFPRRNRIISGLSLGTLVIEAHSRSGSLITARLAGEQGREVFALPGPVNQLTSRGSHALIKEGAALVESPEDVFQGLKILLKEGLLEQDLFAISPGALNPEIETKAASSDGGSLTDIEKNILENLKSTPLFYEELMDRVDYPGPAIVSTLTLLELRKHILRSRDGRLCLSVK